MVLVESDVSGSVVETPAVSSPLVALAPAVVESPPALQPVARPTAVAQAIQAGSPPPAAALPAIIQPGPSLVLSVANPQPGDLVPRGKYVMQGLAFDRAATSGTGVDRVSVFIDDRDAGGQLVGDAKLGQPSPTGFTVTADLSKTSGGHTLFVYARSSVSGKEAVVSFPVIIGSR